MRAEAAFFLFHLRVGARLALRVLAPVLAATLFLYYILRPEFMLELARILYVEGSLAESGLVGTLILLGLGRVVAPRVAAGSRGWARSLPANGRALRRLMAVSMVIAEAPLLAVLGGLAGAVTGPNATRIAIPLAGLIAGAAAAGLACLPGPRISLTRLLSIAACFLSFSGNATGLGLSAGLLILSAVLPTEFPAPLQRRRPHRSLPPAMFFFGLALRAVRGRVLLAYLTPAIVLAAGRLFLGNNELPEDAAFSLSLFALVLSLNVFIGRTADLLASRRPAWPWLRSLPSSAASRVMSDALFFIVLALPLAGGLALLGRPAREVAYLAGPLAWFAFRGAGAMREAGDRPFGVLGQVVVEGAVLSLVAALLSWTSWILAAAAPAAFLLARGAERRLKPTRWSERRHSGAGDPLSWSAS